ncbi:MAG TPA: pyridoxal phosphate-dependent aminotransferase [Acidobacteriota bacterium]|nr:pyridoxal phosphate-dependent aminotransferase [Acidobacteriota bacterium]
MESKKPSLAPSLSGVSQSRIRELADIAMSMDGVLRLYFGESNQPTPRYIKDAAVRALNEGYTFYTENAGLPSLRRAIACKYREIHGVDLDWKNIVITASGVQALNVSIRCVLDPGDEAIVLTPAWPNGAAIAGMCSARAIELPHVLHDGAYQIDFDALESAITDRTRLLLYTSPSNPLGWVAKAGDQDRLLEICRRRGLWLLADEVYERIYYNGPVAPSILRKTTPDDAVIVVQSFSKSYCMTGWRLGWLVSRADLARKATHLNEFIVSHAPSMAQKAAETALLHGEGEIRSMVERLRENRDFVREALRSMPGITAPQAEGAFYLFPKIAGLQDSFDFCRMLLLEKRVGIAPGVAFGAGGEGSVRICYAADRSVLEPAMERLRSFLHGM